MIAKGARVPRLVEGVDLTSLPLSPLEGFVLSRIDGAASVQVLADLTNLEVDAVYEMVERLIVLSAAEWARESVSLPLPTGRAATRTPSREVDVPPFLRGPPSRPAPSRVRIQGEKKPPSRPGMARPPGVYSSTPPSAEEVDFSRSSVFPSSSPKASHTGPPKPSGEVEEDTTSEAPLVVPPSPKPPAIAGVPLPPPPSSARLEELSRSAPPPAADAVPDLERLPNLPPPPVVDPSSEPESADEPFPPEESSLERDLAEFSAALEKATAEVEAKRAAATADEVGSEPANDAPPAAASASAPASASASAFAPASASASASAPASASASAPAPASASASPPEPQPEPEATEELDLDAERQKRIDDLYFALELLDHYQVLGVERTAPRNDVRAAYFQLSKVFHPDTMFRKRLGPYKARMEAIFQRLTEAYETLGKKKHREEYDHYLEIQDRTRSVERSLEEHPEQDERERLGRQAAQYEADVAAGRPPSSAGTEVPEELRAPSEPAPTAPSSAPPEGAGSSTPPARREMSEEGKRRQRELMAKKLRHATRASGAGRRAPSPPPPAAPPKADRDEVLRSLASTLKQTSAQTGGLDRVQRHLAAAKRAEADGDIAGAANFLRAALLVAPDRKDVEVELARVGKILATSLATSYEEQALYEQRHGKWAAAAISWGKVVEGRPDDPNAARCAAVALLEARGDMHKARELAQRAVDMDGDNVLNLRALGRVYIAAGLGLNARRVLERAAKLDPDDEMVENLLRDLGR